MTSESKDALAQLAQRLFNDAIHNILHDIVINRHREHKRLLTSLDPGDRLAHCSTCLLPRLLDPPLAPIVRGATTEPPLNTTYCDRKPWSQRPGYDIYDNPFPRSDVTGRPPTKKEREAAKNSKKDDAAGDDTNNGGSPPSPNIAADEQSASSTAKLEKGEKKASKIDEKLKKGEYVPWQTCPNCKRSLLITRFAKHLEQCMGLSGRAASRNAMAKMNGSTPGGSRNGTPAPTGTSQDGKDADDEDNDDDVEVKGAKNAMRKQLLKKGVDKKLKDQKKQQQLTANGKLSRVSSISGKRASPAPSTSDGNKRDRDDMSNGEEDDDGDELHVKKRQKMSRVDSQASVDSSTINGVGQDLERAESQDGSFVDDGSVVDE